MSEEKSVDWKSIETDYRAGIKSLRTIAGEHGVTEGAIRKRAKRDLWERDLAPKIKAKTDDLVRKATVRSVVRSETTVSEKQEIAINAQVQTDIILAHRRDIPRVRNLAMALLEEAEIATGNNDLLRDLAALMYSPDKNGVDKLNEAYQKVISMPGRVDAVKKLAETLKVMIALEREAFGIDADKGAGGPEEFLKRLAGHVDISG